MQRPIHCSKLQSPYLDVQAMLGKSSRAASRVQTLPVGNSIFCLGQFHPLCLESGFSKKKKTPHFPHSVIKRTIQAWVVCLCETFEMRSRDWRVAVLTETSCSPLKRSILERIFPTRR